MYFLVVSLILFQGSCLYSFVSNQQGSSPWLQSLIQRQFVLIFSAVAFLLLRLKVMGLSPPTFQVHDNPHSFANGSLYRVGIVLYSYYSYLQDEAYFGVLHRHLEKNFDFLSILLIY